MKAFLKAFLVLSAVAFTSRTEALMYPVRPYDPNIARWLSRDLTKFKTPPSALSNTERYMESDWSLSSDNCMTFTFSVVVSAVGKVASDPNATQREKDEAKVLLGLAWGAVFAPTPTSVESMLENAGKKHSWIEKKNSGGQNSNSSPNRSCCGSGS